MFVPMTFDGLLYFTFGYVNILLALSKEKPIMHTLKVATAILDQCQIAPTHTGYASLHKLLAQHLEKIAYNVAAISGTFAVVQEKKTISGVHMTMAEQYITTTCKSKCKGKKMAGGNPGTTLPPSFFGATESRYSEDNVGVDRNMVDFEKGVQYHGLEMSGGAPKISVAPLVACAKHTYREEGLRLSAEAQTKMTAIFDRHIKSLLDDICGKKKLSSETLSSILRKKRHAVFH